MDVIGVPQNLPAEFHPMVASLVNENARLLEQVRFLERQLFGKKSEEHLSGVYVLPKGALFNEAEELMAKEPESPQEETVPVQGHVRKTGGRKPLPAHLPREIRIHDIPEEKKVCPLDGTTLVRIGEEVVEKLDVEPAKAKVIAHHYLKYSCPCCEQHVARPEAEPSVLPGSQAEAGLLAHIAVQKFLFALPLYRQEQLFAQMGIELPRVTMARWMMAAGEFVLPLVLQMRAHLVSQAVLHCDETPVQVLKGTGKAPTATTYMWVLGSAEDDPPIAYFEYHNSRSQEAAENLLRDFQGYLQVDGYAGYNSVCADPKVTRVSCWAHARRKFDSAKQDGAKAGVSLAEEFLEEMKKLFLLERDLKSLSPEKRLEARKQQAPPVLAELRKKLDENLTKVPPRSKLGTALRYLAEEWDGLLRFLEDGRVSLSNNRVENFIRPFAVGRKNWLFADTVLGAQASAALYSLAVTAKLNGHDVAGYFRDVFTRLPARLKAAPEAPLDDLLPWLWKAPK